MTADPVTIQGSVDVFEAFEVFKSATARRLPVLEDEELAGIISVDDLLISLVAEFGAVMSPVAQELRPPGLTGAPVRRSPASRPAARRPPAPRPPALGHG